VHARARRRRCRYRHRDFFGLRRRRLDIFRRIFRRGRRRRLLRRAGRRFFVDRPEKRRWRDLDYFINNAGAVAGLAGALRIGLRPRVLAADGSARSAAGLA